MLNQQSAPPSPQKNLKMRMYSKIFIVSSPIVNSDE